MTSQSELLVRVETQAEPHPSGVKDTVLLKAITFKTTSKMKCKLPIFETEQSDEKGRCQVNLLQGQAPGPMIRSTSASYDSISDATSNVVSS